MSRQVEFGAGRTEQEKRLQRTARYRAERTNADTHWHVVVEHSSHEELQQGKVAPRVSHVVLSKREFPRRIDAEQTAYLIGVRRGEYPTSATTVEVGR